MSANVIATCIKADVDTTGYCCALTELVLQFASLRKILLQNLPVFIEIIFIHFLHLSVSLRRNPCLTSREDNPIRLGVALCF